MLNSVRTRALDCAYLERGPAGGEPVLLVHGFPDDARTWDAVAAEFAADGFRTIAPFVRGFGPRRLPPDAPRTGEIAALARDVLDLADALGIERFHIVGHDWGARAAQRLDVEQLRAYWYQWYFATPRGAAALRGEHAAFCLDLWRTWSPRWAFSNDEYAATARSFDNPDFVDIVLHSYRQRWGFAPGAAAYAADRARLEQIPPIAVPSVAMLGRDDGATLPTSAADAGRLFSGDYTLHVLDGTGHFVQREQPQAVVAAVRSALRADARLGRGKG